MHCFNAPSSVRVSTFGNYSLDKFAISCIRLHHGKVLYIALHVLSREQRGFAYLLSDRLCRMPPLLDEQSGLVDLRSDVICRDLLRIDMEIVIDMQPGSAPTSVGVVALRQRS